MPLPRVGDRCANSWSAKYKLSSTGPRNLSDHCFKGVKSVGEMQGDLQVQGQLQVQCEIQSQHRSHGHKLVPLLATGCLYEG